MTDCGPISYSRYEGYVTSGGTLHVSWRDANGHCHERELVPKDLRARDGEQFLVLEDHRGGYFELRLGSIIDIHPIGS